MRLLSSILTLLLTAQLHAAIGVAYDGNSMTDSNYSSYPATTMTLLGSGYTLLGNFGVSGQTTTEMASDAATQIDPLVTPGAFLVVWEIRNEIRNAGVDYRVAFTNMMTYCSNRTAVGWRVVLLTMLPGDSLVETQRTLVNACTLASPYIVANVAGDPRIGDGGDNLDTTYYSDGTHMTAAGYNIVAGIVANAILSNAVIVIGTNSLITRYDSDNYATIVPWNPGDGETVSQNPPRFSWPYSQLTNASDLSTYCFKFQCSSNSDMSTPTVDMFTPYNFYNFVDHFTSSTVYWRIGYVCFTNIADPDVGYGTYTITPLSPPTTNWTATRSFVITNGTPQWDHAMFADTNFLATNGVHPHLGFREGEQLSVSNFFATNTLNGFNYYWSAELTDVPAFTNSWWWNGQLYHLGETNFTHPDYKFSSMLSFGQAMARAAFLFQIQGYTWITNQGYLQSNVNWMATAIRTNGYSALNASLDSYGSIGVPLAYTYDWLYPVLTTEQRTNILQTLTEHCDAHRTNFCFYTFKTDQGGKKVSVMLGNTMAKRFESHSWDAFGVAAIYGLATYGDNDKCREWFNCSFNYILGKGAQFAGADGGWDRGRASYGIGDYLHFVSRVSPFYETFKGQGMTNYAGIKDKANWDKFFHPLGYRHSGDDTWGDGGYGFSGGYTYEQHQLWPYMDSVARMTGDGVVQKLYSRSSEFIAREYSFSYANATFNFNYNTPPAEVDYTNQFTVFSKSGWVMGTSGTPTDYGSFSNSVGFIMQARPSGGDQNHTFGSDGDVQIWAYGAPVTEGGGAYDSSQNWVGTSRNTWLINNQYISSAQWPQNEVMAKVLAAEQGANYSYAMVETAPAFLGTTNVLRARRHLLFMRGKYFVFYDDLQTQTNSTFAWNFHIRQPSLTHLSPGAFKYTTTNLYIGRPSVTNFVAHIASTNLIGYRQLDLGTSGEVETGYYTNVVASHPFTGVMGSRSSDTFRNHALFFTNAAPATNWHFMWVLYPVTNGNPTFTILSDNTVAVTNGSEGDVISFGETNALSTLIVATLNAVNNPTNSESGGDSPAASGSVIRVGGTLQGLQGRF